MCWTNGVWDEELHQEAVALAIQDLSEGKPTRGCVHRQSSKDILESSTDDDYFTKEEKEILNSQAFKDFVAKEEAMAKLIESTKL